MCMVECVTNCTNLFAYISNESNPKLGNLIIDTPKTYIIQKIKNENETEVFGDFKIDVSETAFQHGQNLASVRNFDVERYEKVLGKGNVNMNLPAEVLEAQCRQVQQARQEQTALCVLIAIGIFLGLIIVVSSCSHKVTFVAVENSEILEGNENLE